MGGMRMYRIAVCDDEAAVTKQVMGMIEEWDGAVAVDCFSSGEELLSGYRPYDAVFLDIDMAGIDGIETAKRLRLLDKETKIVYLTAYRDYVAGAFAVHAFQYLLKPVSRKKLWDILEELFRYAQSCAKKTILDFQTADGLACIAAEDICYFEYVNRRIRIVAGDGEYFTAGKISGVYERMKNLGFSSPHKSFVVNMLHVKNVQNQQIFMDNGEQLPLSQSGRSCLSRNLRRIFLKGWRELGSKRHSHDYKYSGFIFCFA